MNAGEGRPHTTRADQGVPFRRLAPFFAAVYFVQGIAEPGAGIGSQPLLYLLKDGLKLGPADTAAFMAMIAVAWTIKPLYGLISDFFPLFGYRRKSYLLCTTALAATGWCVLGLQQTHTYWSSLMLLMLCGLGLAFSDVLCDAVMVEAGKPLEMTGRFQSVQWGAINTASLLAGIGGGWLAQYVSPQHTFLFISFFPALSFVTTALTLRDPRVHFDREALRSTARAIWSAIGSRPLWLAAGFIFLWNFSPSFGVPLQFYIIDTLKFSKMSLGMLLSLGSAGSILGAFLFGRYLRHVRLQRLLNISIGIGVASTLAYWGLVGWWSAMILTLVTGASTMVAILAILDLAARSCPDKAEGTFFSALMSVYNLSAIGSANVGGRLFELVGFRWLILISGAATAICWVVVPWLRVPEERREVAERSKVEEPASGPA